MPNSSPSIQEWADLYEACLEFKQLAPWRWMSDTFLFGIQNPEDGETGYCCVLGNMNEVYALVMYLGPYGLDVYRRMSAGEMTPDSEKLLRQQKCLMVSFEDSRSAEPPDRKVIKELGLRFRGRNAWPIFRSLEPGYVPWFLEGNHARFLTLALRYAAEVSKRVLCDDLDLVNEESYLVRVPETKDGVLVWEERWLKPPLCEKPKTVPPAIDEDRLEKIKESSVRYPGTWEVDFFFAPMAVGEEMESRPYFPHLLLCVDRDSNYILDFQMSAPERYQSQFVNKLVEIAEHVGKLPKRIVVENQELAELLAPVATKLEVPLSRAKNLKAIERARKEMFRSLL